MAHRAPHHGQPSGPVDQSPWYTGQESTQTPEPGAHRQWRQARADWLQTSRAEDFERMLAAVTLDNPVGADYRYPHGAHEAAPLWIARRFCG